MKILCTGNPKNSALAAAIDLRWPATDFVSRSTGLDLVFLDDDKLLEFTHKINNCDVFINSSYIGPGVQSKLAQIVSNTWMEKNIKGHIINIGTTAEWSMSDQSNSYLESKKELRQISLSMNDLTGITGVKVTHVILGGINDGTEQNRDFVDPGSVIIALEWLLQFPDRIALLQIEKAK